MACTTHRRPKQNKVVGDRWEAYCQAIHVHKLVHVKPEVDVRHKEPWKPSETRKAEASKGRDSKRLSLRREREREIQQDNENLLKKILEIERTSEAKRRHRKARKKKRVLEARHKLHAAKRSGNALEAQVQRDHIELASMTTDMHRLHANRAVARHGRLRREQERIAKENERMMKRLISARPSISARKLEDDARKHEKLVQNLSEYPQHRVLDLSHLTLKAVQASMAQTNGKPVVPTSPSKMLSASRRRMSGGVGTRRKLRPAKFNPTNAPEEGARAQRTPYSSLRVETGGSMCRTTVTLPAEDNKESSMTIQLPSDWDDTDLQEGDDHSAVSDAREACSPCTDENSIVAIDSGGSRLHAQFSPTSPSPPELGNAEIRGNKNIAKDFAATSPAAASAEEAAPNSARMEEAKVLQMLRNETMVRDVESEVLLPHQLHNSRKHKPHKEVSPVEVFIPADVLNSPYKDVPGEELLLSFKSSSHRSVGLVEESVRRGSRASLDGISSHYSGRSSAGRSTDGLAPNATASFKLRPPKAKQKDPDQTGPLLPLMLRNDESMHSLQSFRSMTSRVRNEEGASVHTHTPTSPMPDTAGSHQEAPGASTARSSSATPEAAAAKDDDVKTTADACRTPPPPAAAGCGAENAVATAITEQARAVAIDTATKAVAQAVARAAAVPKP